eukprot:TRINITY_DN669_c0_g1_i5.p1 TRINITY_DN669_c0_g1~~TRINITY_DN669_c0_g1_i5.p1  ORF type:complete len:176 (+),score=26.84 TRINITY_DN669_c0_g1_i5:299-826(+)
MEGYKSRLDFLESMWKAGEEEPREKKKRLPDGHPHIFFFRRDWDILKLGDWNVKDNISQQASLSNKTIEAEMGVPSANIFDPSVYGSRATLEESRASLSKWVHLWAATNSVMVLNEEREQSIHRTMTNVPGRVMFEHMNLSEGDIYGLPSISLWFRERRWCPKKVGVRRAQSGHV